MSLISGKGKVEYHLLAVSIPISPTQAIALIFANVWMLPSEKPMIAATATKTAVQAPWLDMALKEIDMPSIPDPATKIQSSRLLVLNGKILQLSVGLTENKCASKYDSAWTAKHQISCIVDTIDLGVSQLEYANNIV